MVSASGHADFNVHDVSPTDSGPEFYTPPEICAVAEITYRNLDYWLRAGHIDLDPDHEHYRTPGSGVPRKFTLLEAQRFRMLARLVKAGLNLHIAAAVVRRLEANGFESVALADGVWLRVDR